MTDFAAVETISGQKRIIAPRSSHRSGRAMMTFSAGALYTAVTVIVGFIATPLLLKFLGAERLGASRAVADWIGYLVLADFGVGGAIGVMLLRAHGQRDQAAKIGIAKFAIRLFAILSIISLLIGVALAWNMPKLIRADGAMSRELQIAAFISLGGLLLAPLAVFRSVLEVEQRGYLIHFALLLQSLSVSILGVFLAWRGGGLIGQATALLIGAALFFVLILCFALRGMKQFRAHARATVPTKELWQLSWPLALAGLGVRINVMTDSIVTGYLLGPAMVTSLFVTQRLVQLCGSQVNSMVNASWAALAELRAAGHEKLFAERVCELARLIVGVGLTITGTLAAYNSHFVHLWVGKNNYGGDAVSILAGVASILLGFTLLFAWIIDSHGDTRRRLPMSIAGAIANLTLSILFVKRFGLFGVLLGTVLAEVMTNTWYCPRIVVKRYGVPARAIVLAAARGILCGAPWAIAVWLFAHSHVPPARWLGFAAELLLMSIFAVMYCWFALLGSTERTRWKQRLAFIVSKAP